MTPGTSQRDRPLAALGEAQFPVDGLALDQRVALSTRLAGRLRFINLHNQAEGNWRQLFVNDESLVLARISSLDTWGVRTRYLQVCDSTAPDELARWVSELAQLINSWLHELSGARLPAALRVREALEQRVEQQLGATQAWLRQHYPGADAGMRETWHGKWHPPAAGEVGSRGDPAATLRSAGFSLLNALSTVKALAREGLPSTLDTGDHEAAPGLLLAFLRLYGVVQADINGFTDRHIDFYYRRVLGFLPQDTQPDLALVACQRDPRAGIEVVVPAGTRFLAGKDAAGEDIVFRSGEAMPLSNARVAAMATLRLEHDPLIQPEASLGFATGIRAHWLDVPGADASPVPALGGGTGSHEARPGLAVASPLLWLKEGRREINVTLRLRWPREQPASDKATAWGRQAARRMLDPSGPPSDVPLPWLSAGGGQPLTPEQVFYQHASQLFDAWLTTPQGWFKATRVQVRPAPVAPGTGVGLQVRLLLEPEDPPITACDSKVHEAKWATQLPLLRLTTSPQAQVHPYSLLAGIELEQVELAVDVQDVQDLVLANQLGPLDPNKPFAPFGPVPTTSSFLLLGAPELAVKPLDALRVRLRWGGLPQGPGGFAALYDSYGREQAEGPFTAAVSVLRDGQWVGCSGASAAQPLFAESTGNGRVPQDQVFDVDAPSLQQNMRPGGDLTQGAALARNGVLRLVLNQPAGAFGHAAYPGLLAAALQSRARRFGHLPMPQPPYTPQLERITLAYRSHAVLKPSAQLSDLQADPPRLLHEHPFGVTEVRAAEPGGVVGVLPDLGPNGNLCIGLEGAAAGGLLTLLFQLDEAGAADWIGPGPRPPLRWSLLRNERWEALPASQVLYDGTQGLLSSGIVRLDLEPMPDLDSRVFGHGLLWLRLTMDEGLETCARLVTVHAQALELRRESAAAVAGLGLVGQPLPPGAIAGPQNSLPGLASVLQPEASMGLRAAEGPREMRTRAGERLRHKNRASLAWDVERLVLQAFPEVFKVKCFTPPQAGCKPGEPLVVVVPHVRRNDPDVVSVAAKLDAVDLQHIREFLGQHMSPFVRPVVRNASYERVQLRCRVQLLSRVHTGAVLREIERRIGAWLSPWHDEGPGAQFQWQLSADDLQGIVRLVPGVASVGPVSLLRIARDDEGAYSLADTARRPVGAVSQLQHRQAWSLMLPMETHLIETGPVPDEDEPLTVVSRMKIGSTFVITQGAAP